MEQHEIVLQHWEESIKSSLVALKQIERDQVRLGSQAIAIRQSIRAESESYKQLTGRYPSFVNENELRGKPRSGVKAKIGDAMESILKEYHSLTTKEIVEKLRERNVQTSSENALSVVSMTTKQDVAKRFMRGLDGRIILRKKTENDVNTGVVD